MSIIEANHLSRSYRNGKGIFDITFAVEEGEVLGFLGPDGAGKTTILRHLMGFAMPTTGEAFVDGLHCFKQRPEIQKNAGYLPEKPGLDEHMTGTAFIRFCAKMKKVKQMDRAEELIALFELDAEEKIKNMSAEEKQKVGLVCAFLSDPKLVILDEPTNGLGSKMKEKLMDLILQEKEKGTTILLSSREFELIERVCSRVAVIRDGCVAAIEDIEDLCSQRKNEFTIRFFDEEMAEAFVTAIQGGTRNRDVVHVRIKGDADKLIKVLAMYSVKDIQIRAQSLEELFMHYYGGEQ